MAQNQLVTVIGYGIFAAMFAPVIGGALVIALGAIREKRQSRRGLDEPVRAFRGSKKQTPLHVVERSAGGFVRIRPLPMRSLSKKPR